MTVFQSDQVSPHLAPKAFKPSAKWLGVVVAFISILAFCPILTNNFITLDDGNLVSHNPDFNPPQPSHWGHYWTGPTQEAFKPHELYMPITNMLWGVTSVVAQTADSEGKTTLNPAVFHGVSLLLHAINAVLVFVLLRKLVAGEWPAFFGALLFAVHPLQTESVAWVAETSILLSGVFSLGAVYEFLQFSDLRALGDSSPNAPGAKNASRPGVPRKRAWIHYTFGTLALALALLSKAPAVVVPAMVLIIEVILRDRDWRKLIGPLGLWGLICLPVVFLTRHWQVSHFTVPVTHRPVVAADALAFYLYKIFLPIGLLPNYDRTPAWLMAPAHHAIAMSTWLAPLALLILCLTLWRRARWLAAAALLFAVALLPVLGLSVFVYQRFSTTADRYVYLAMIGPALALACLIALRPRPAILVAASVLVAVLASLSIRQSTFWSDSLRLFTRVIDAHPDSQKGQKQVAVAYDARAKTELAANNHHAAWESIQLARDHFLLAAALPDDDGISYYNAGNTSFSLHDIPDAIRYFQAALRDPTFELRAAAYNRLGICYQSLKNNAAAAEAYRNALNASNDPGMASDHMAAAEYLHRLELDQSLDAAKGLEAKTR